MNKIKKNSFVLFVDISIEFKPELIWNVVNKLNKVGMEWFGETSERNTDLYMFESNHILMKRNFVNALIMKVWLSCALQKECIIKNLIDKFYFKTHFSNNTALDLFPFLFSHI